MGYTKVSLVPQWNPLKEPLKRGFITHYFPKTIHFFSFIQTELANKVFCRALSFYNVYFGKENQTEDKTDEEICHD